MQITMGKEGLEKTQQFEEFPEETKCCKCGGVARIGFVAHEGIDEDVTFSECLCSIDPEDGGYWLHDRCSVAVYFCGGCLEPTALYNQG